MDESVLISINPPHTNNIFDGIKGIEWRTKPMPAGKHYCYETRKCFGLGKVIGEFRIWRIKRYERVDLIPEEHIRLGCVPIEFLQAYSKGRPLYAHFIISPKRYDIPKELSCFSVADKAAIALCQFRERAFNNPDDTNGALLPGRYVCTKGDFDWCVECRTKPLTRPPQSWCYVKEVNQGGMCEK